MSEFVLLALCGSFGAALYGFPILLAALSAVPPGRFAWASMAFSVVVGAVTAPLLTPMLGRHWEFLVIPEPYPLAIGIGLAANPLAPILVRKLTGWADSYQIGTKK